MRHVTSATFLCLLVFIASFASANDGECTPDRPENCVGGKGSTSLKPDESATFMHEGLDDDPFPEDEEIVDTSDPKNWPEARFPDVDLSGDVEEVDLSNMQGANISDTDFPADQEDPESDNNKKVDTEANPEEQLDTEAKEMAAFERIMSRLEQLANEWCCATGGVALTENEGDAEVFEMFATTVSETLRAMNQEFGAQMIGQWQESRTKPEFNCSAVTRGDKAYFNNAVNIVMEGKELLNQWLTKREVESSELIDEITPLLRSLISRWAVMRLMVSKEAEDGAEAPSEPLNDAIGAALLPIVKNDDNPTDTCSAAEGLYVVYAKTAPAGHKSSLLGEINTLLDICYTAGKTSEEPVKFGRTLLATDRETQARELFALAVDRGEICHALQRPEQLHRKDLTARAMWKPSYFPELGKLPELGKKATEKLPNLEFGDKAQMGSFILTGTWERAVLYTDSELNNKTCDSLGSELCNEFQEFIEAVLDENDAYLFACNGSLTIEFWKLTPPVTSPADTGTANLVLQVLLPLQENGNTMTVRAGEETALMEEGEVVIMDDTFENNFEISKDDEGSAGSYYVLHLQVCHPDMHDKALMVPGKKCASAPQE